MLFSFALVLFFYFFLFFKRGFLICSFDFDALNIIYVHLTNFKNKFNLPMRENLHSKCMFFFLMFRFLLEKNNSMKKSIFKFDVVLSTMSDSTFAMILITKA